MNQPIPEKVVFGDHGTTIVDSTKRRQDAKGGLGQRHRKIDALAKATGRAAYTDDISLPGMLVCKIKRSTRAHARLISIDTSAAVALPGVEAVLLGTEMPIPYGIIPWTIDEQALCTDKVRFIGDAICAVAAQSEEVANAAIAAILVEYEDLPSVLDTTVAAQTGDDIESKVNAKAKKGNITKRVNLSYGDVDAGFAKAEHVVDDTFFFQGTTHAAIEPHCAIGQWDGRRLTVTSSTQVPHYLHRDLARVLELNASQIRVLQPALGGAFGGKSEPFDLEFCVAKLAIKTGQPVKCLYTREEVFMAHRGRHPMRMHMRTAADADGHILACENDVDIDGGAYASFGMITAYYAGQLLTGPVGMAAYRFSATRYYTNKPACGPKRGHGSVQPRFAYEIHLDMLAERCGLDPILLRRKNAVKAGSETVNGMQMGSAGLNACLDSVAKASDWEHRKTLPEGRGLGVASSMYISGTNYPIYPNDMPQSGVQVAIERSGRVTLFCGASDIGQGSDCVLATIAREELGVVDHDVVVVSSDTDLCPVDLGSYSSRVTMMMGHAAQEACRSLREQVQQAVAAHWNAGERTDEALSLLTPEDVLLDEGRVWCAKDTERSMTTREAFCIAEGHFGTLGAQGGYRTKERGGKYRGGAIGASPAYSATAHIADVSVCEQTGRITVHRIWVAHDCGKALNPMLVEGQIEGSTYMGMAEVALEDMLYGEANSSRAGMLVGPSLLDYRIPTTLDTPAISASFVEVPEPNGPYGAKEAGEGPLHSTIPAIANAIYAAAGIRLVELPFSPKKVLAALAKRDAAGEQASRQGGR